MIAADPPCPSCLGRGWGPTCAPGLLVLCHTCHGSGLDELLLTHELMESPPATPPEPTIRQDVLFQFCLDGRPSAPARRSWEAAVTDAIRDGYATWMRDGEVRLDSTQGVTIERVHAS